MKILPILTVAIFMTLTGCVARKPMDPVLLFKLTTDQLIGQPIWEAYGYPHYFHQRVDGPSPNHPGNHEAHIAVGNCELAVEYVLDTARIVSWRYLSDEKSCKKYVGPIT